MNSEIDATLVARQDVPRGSGSTLICGSVPPGFASPTSHLGDGAAWVFLTPADETPCPGGLRKVTTCRIPDGIPPDLAAGHGIFCLALLELAAKLEFEHLWFVHYNVYLAGSWPEFFRSFEDSDADFLAPVLRTRSSDPEWYWWKSLAAPDGQSLPNECHQFAALSTIFRISRKGFDGVRAAVEAGWLGHVEALLPTVVRMAGLKIEDIGSDGELTPNTRRGRHYHVDTFGCDFPREERDGFLHYPVPPPISPPSPHRYRPPSTDSPRILYFSPVGPGASDLFTATSERFKRAAAEILLVEYADSGISVSNNGEMFRDKGEKWELAKKYLNPARVKDFDFVFIWDDDIGIGDFDVRRFLQIMEANRLDMAQPSIVSPHPVCHGITRQQPCPPPLGRYRRVGRLTNFVEIMVPVFTRDCWLDLCSYLSPEFRLGWGLDSLPLGRKGIVDCMNVVHTRPCNDFGPEAYIEMERLLTSNGRSTYRHQDLGHLLEAPLAPSVPE